MSCRPLKYTSICPTKNVQLLGGWPPTNNRRGLCSTDTLELRRTELEYRRYCSQCRLAVARIFHVLDDNVFQVLKIGSYSCQPSCVLADVPSLSALRSKRLISSFKAWHCGIRKFSCLDQREHALAPLRVHSALGGPLPGPLTPVLSAGFPIALLAVQPARVSFQPLLVI